MSMERLKFKGRREEIRLEIERLKLRLAMYRDELRDQLDPTVPVEKLSEQKVFTLATEFAGAFGKLRLLLDEMAAIRDLLEV